MEEFLSELQIILPLTFHNHRRDTENPKSYFSGSTINLFSEDVPCVQGQGATKRCRLSWLTKRPNIWAQTQEGGGGCCGVSANEYSCTHGAQINFGDLTPYLTYAFVSL
jgi:hypothetical protein